MSYNSLQSFKLIPILLFALGFGYSAIGLDAGACSTKNILRKEKGSSKRMKTANTSIAVDVGSRFIWEINTSVA